ncbi:MAG: hypothetical protein IJD02_01520 [Lachnospiraceae bacterium]|nr:hypothetical protein [Lachnospiraceae bacterium]
MKKSSNLSIGNGMVSIFLIFIALSLTCFCVLAFLSSNIDKKYTDKRCEETAKYYESDRQAREKLRLIDEMVMTSLSQGLPTELIVEQLCEIDGVKANIQGDKMKVEYQVDIDDNKNISVCLNIDKDGKYEINKWKTSASSELITDDPLNLWDGN